MHTFVIFVAGFIYQEKEKNKHVGNPYGFVYPHHFQFLNNLLIEI